MFYFHFPADGALCWLDRLSVFSVLQAEEAKLITQLAEMDAINYGLFEQAYSASLDVSKFLDQYAMLKLLKGPYDAEGAAMVIEAGPGGMHDEVWCSVLFMMI